MTVNVSVEQEIRIPTFGGTANNSFCLPEFSHNGVKYDKCTVVNSPDSWKPWCKTSERKSREEDKWGFCDCAIKPRPPRPLGPPSPPRSLCPSLNGLCELYNAGPVCKPYLNGSTVFVDNNYSQTFLQNEVLETLNSSFFRYEGSATCSVLSLQIFCHLLFPGCQKSSTTRPNDTVPLLLCYSSCNTLENSTCGFRFKKIMKDAVFDRFQKRQWNPVHFYAGNPPCQGLPRNDNGDDNCVEISIDVPPEDKKTKQSTEYTVIVAVVVPTVSIVLVTLLCLWRRKTKGKFISLADLEFSEIVWDADVAQAIPESLIDQKRLELEKQIGEGET